MAVNGMSYSGRDGENANSAIIVTVTPRDFGSEDPLAGVAFQRELERRAYEAGGGKIPVQRYGDFKRQIETEEGLSAEDGLSMEEKYSMEERHSREYSEDREDCLGPQCKGAYQWADVTQILPKECNEAIVEGMELFAGQIAGFNREDACLSGVESRTSSPVRILRDDNLQSRIKGLYPCGEGAGYAGGIVSAAMDGIRVAEKIAEEFEPPTPQNSFFHFQKETCQ